MKPEEICGIIFIIFFILLVLVAIRVSTTRIIDDGVDDLESGNLKKGGRAKRHTKKVSFADPITDSRLSDSQIINRFPTYITDQPIGNYSQFEIAPGKVSIYSSLMPWHIPDMNAAICAEVARISPTWTPSTILDLTAHIGADSANFMKLFPYAKITSVEIDPSIAAILKRNMDNISTTKSNNEVINDDARNVIKDYISTGKPADIIFIDPPWLGSRDIPKLGGESLIDYVKMLGQIKTEIILVKLPRESDYNKFAVSVGMPYNIYPIHTQTSKISFWLIAFHRG
jgi:predicted RNA methylase